MGIMKPRIGVKNKHNFQGCNFLWEKKNRWPCKWWNRSNLTFYLRKIWRSPHWPALPRRAFRTPTAQTSQAGLTCGDLKMLTREQVFFTLKAYTFYIQCFFEGLLTKSEKQPGPKMFPPFLMAVTVHWIFPEIRRFPFQKTYFLGGPKLVWRRFNLKRTIHCELIVLVREDI